MSDHFRQDISAYWSHATFYTVLQGALATVLATTVGPGDPDAGPALLAPSVLAFLLSVAGLLFATTWLLSALGRRRLIAEWRNQVLHHEGLVEPTHRSYLQVERVARRHPLEPTKVTLLVPCALAIAWGVALVWSAAMVW